jgi:5,5'-dehydrodivanillate O-demethylase
VLSEEKNRHLTQVGPGTPMGNVLRRHWHAIAGIDDLAKNTVKPVRLMGEDLVLFKDRSGAYGLIDRHCAHRRADLSYGYVEPDGIRCNYHGWKFNAAGRCIAQPYEEVADPQARQKCKIQLKAYKVQPHAGMLWVYMGPDPKGLIRDPAINHRVVLPSDSRDFSRMAWCQKITCATLNGAACSTISSFMPASQNGGNKPMKPRQV